MGYEAARIHRFGGPEVIVLDEMPVPEPEPGQMCIRVQAASVNPVDYKIRRGGYLPADKLPITLGRDVAGVVERLGPGVDGAFREGSAVFAMVERDNGGNAEFTLARPDICAPLARGLDAVQAGAIPLAGLTAWQGLCDHGGLQEGQRVLIHGGVGAVGHLAVQFAKARGAQVFATCAGQDAEFVHGLGADVVINYKTERFEDRVRDLDMVFDLIAGEVQDRSWAVLRQGGILVSTLAEPDKQKAAARGARGTRYMAQPNGAELREIAGLVENCRVRVHLHRRFPLAAVAEAHRVLEQERVRGKIVLQVA
jgi:NADPH:quinone reductase-like Zn-dependent oxidoreductase